jgi:putative flippase GtrA
VVAFASRAAQALRTPGNWLQLGKFLVVGASGYVVNLAVYASLVEGWGAHRAAQALRTPGNWLQLGKFLVVGASGYVVNLAVYASLVEGWGAHRAAAVSFVVSAANNYLWNHLWTFKGSSGRVGAQGMRFLVVSLAAFAVNQLWLVVFVDWLDWRKVAAQAVAIVLVTPLNFIGNKLWSFRR